MQISEKSLAEKECRACEGTEKPLQEPEILKLLSDLDGWGLINEETVLMREYTMKNFMDAVAFIIQISRIAEAEGHHPDLHLTGYKHLRIELSTHAIGGLSENDFILAAKIDEIPEQRTGIIDKIVNNKNAG